MTGTLEITANVMATLSILLAGRNSIHTWWTGIVGCILFAILFFLAQLYADVLLQVFFVITSGIGWWQWGKGKQGEALPISHADFKKLAWTLPVGLVATVVYGALLHFFTDAYAPFIDSTVLVFSVIAQLLLMQRRIETWAFWLVVNSVAVPLYASRHLYLTALLYACYLVNAAVSWWWWQRLATRNSAAAA
ncbi:nicotinamide riboside transporter PnuC [Collimonas fungivorans]|uniref:nicotinamide riboside transporter PnuC n=1 Tax=Collimonas fungivorans TaxID=158899 RepID=UPI003FA3CF98